MHLTTNKFKCLQNNGSAMNEDFMTPSVVTEITGMSERTLASLRYTGTGPRFYQPTRKTILYRRSEVLAWVEASAKTRSLASSRA